MKHILFETVLFWISCSALVSACVIWAIVPHTHLQLCNLSTTSVIRWPVRSPMIECYLLQCFVIGWVIFWIIHLQHCGSSHYHQINLTLFDMTDSFFCSHIDVYMHWQYFECCFQNSDLYEQLMKRGAVQDLCRQDIWRIRQVQRGSNKEQEVGWSWGNICRCCCCICSWTCCWTRYTTWSQTADKWSLASNSWIMDLLSTKQNCSYSILCWNIS
jgi:hypothetical protein